MTTKCLTRMVNGLLDSIATPDQIKEIYDIGELKEKRKELFLLSKEMHALLWAITNRIEEIEATEFEYRIEVTTTQLFRKTEVIINKVPISNPKAKPVLVKKRAFSLVETALNYAKTVLNTPDGKYTLYINGTRQRSKNDV